MKHLCLFSFLALGFIIAPTASYAQQRLPQVTDSIRRAYNIPELGFAIIKPDTIAALYLCGHHRSNQNDVTDSARVSDYFHLGSNTKAITGFVAGWLVENGQLQWTTKFFDLFPEWKAKSNPSYYDITLSDLLSHRARIQPFTSGAEQKKLPKFKGNPSEQRKQFAKFLLTQDPVAADGESYHYSNAGYSIAALMLEQASGRSWEALVKEVLEEKLQLRYTLGWPNRLNLMQPWGHWMEGGKIQPVAPNVPYDLRLIEPAGDISMPLADYARLIQLHLKGLKGQDNFLKSSTYQYLFTSRPDYSIGWLNATDSEQQLSEHAGSAGTFYCYTLINRKTGIAYVAVANCGGTQAEEGVLALVQQLSD
ncbi:MAG: class A beta-lactamase-related serine hydrolase [Sphingobacteriales bacterium]|nr:MAG: class A beta-lactamase-related serine hydrolase [Sphingobacteriales bacterium]